MNSGDTSRVSSIVEKGGAGFEGITLLLCENPLPPLAEAVEAAAAQLPQSHHYTEPFSAPLRAAIAEELGVAERHIHINAGSEVILRQLFDRLGSHVHLFTPTYPLFPEIARRYTETPLRTEDDFAFTLENLSIPRETTLVVIVNPNNPTGGTFDPTLLRELMRRHPDTWFLVDEAFIDMGGRSVASWVPRSPRLLVTRTFSKAHSLAGFRVGFAVLPEALAHDLNSHNDAYPLARPSQAAALATLRHMDKIRGRVQELRRWTRELAAGLGRLGVKTYPTETYFFLADFWPHKGVEIAEHLAARRILVKPLNDARLGAGFVRMTTATPEENRRVLAALAELSG
jgi:histidinol-phosphate aminotransferase